ncbi:MAG TPA: periplasmic heavy metal sensor [Vicinamibacterales bacterium]|nr:periplasmic heavy metal sensor [Vicinamibacterales bacterium]
MSKRAGFIVAAAIVVAAAGMSAAAQGGPQAGPGGPGFGRRGGPGGPMRGGPGGPGGAIDLPLGQLNLSAQQRDQVKSVMDSHQDDMKALGDREMAAREALQQAITAATVDDNVIRQKSADVAAAEADVAVMRAHVRAEVWQLLTPDQQKQATALEATRPMPGRGRGK